MNNGQGVDVVPGGYGAYGNDGQHFNAAVNGYGFNTAVGLPIANALWAASDHLPVVCTVQVASRLAVAPSLDFGAVITGAAAQQTLHVANGATAPADALDYSLAAPAGFGAPAGPFSAAAGAGNDHAITMSTSVVGARSGNLVVTSDDPDNATKNVALAGTVLAHAVPSLDSTAVSVEDSLRFGAHPAGEFPDPDVRLFDAGYGPLQARLSVAQAAITGGDGRFSIVGGFTPALLGGIGQTWSVHFNSLTARADSTYEATLVFSTADEPLPGAAPQPSVTLHLTATVVGRASGVEPGGLPARLAFLPPRPNPSSGETWFAFDLPRAASATLEIYDANGRRVARPWEGGLEAGRHVLRWTGRDDQGRRLAAGLYFARFRCGDFSRTRRITVLP